MNLNTQCPQCGTTFQVDLEQLQLRKGYIRCINCAHIFDGYEAVVPSSAAKESQAYVADQPADPPPVPSGPVVAQTTPPAPITPSVVRHRTPGGQQAHHIPVNVRPASSAAAPEFVVSSTPSERAVTSTEREFRVGDAAPQVGEPVFDLGRTAAASDVADEPVVSVVHTRSPQGATTPASIYAEARHDFHGRKASREPEFAGSGRTGYGQVATLAWQLAILVAVVVLLGQLAYVYRVQIASQLPALRPALEAACSHLQCSVPYSRRIELINITGAALSAQTPNDGQEGGTMVLQLTLRNAYEKPQEWPTLELDLNDFSGTLQVRKNIAPQNYLTPEQLQQPFGAQTEHALRLPIVLHGLSINGFQIRKFFP